jgi:hypothetical protein
MFGEDEDYAPLTAKTYRAVWENARERLAFYRQRALLSIGLFAAGCAALYPCLEGQPLHRYWDQAGKPILIVDMALWLWLVYQNALWWGAWRALVGVQKRRPENS